VIELANGSSKWNSVLRQFPICEAARNAVAAGSRLNDFGPLALISGEIGNEITRGAAQRVGMAAPNLHNSTPDSIPEFDVERWRSFHLNMPALTCLIE
jgi:hypothetical protein